MRNCRCDCSIIMGLGSEDCSIKDNNADSGGRILSGRENMTAGWEEYFDDGLLER